MKFIYIAPPVQESSGGGEHICDAAKRNALLNNSFSVCICKQLTFISRAFKTLKSMKNLLVNAAR